MSKNQTVNSPELRSEAENYDIICLSHLRWDFVYQRPQHLLSRFTKNGRVFFFEEPIFSDRPTFLDISEREHNLFVVVPHISHDDRENRDAAQIQREMLEKLIQTKELKDFVLWFYTPTAMEFAAHLKPLATVFDCMDELSAFKNAPPELIENERRLLEKADLVFTGGQSLFEAKKDKHRRVFAFPSSIDVAHFGAARNIEEEPADQSEISHPKLGFCGVIDERMDIELLAEMADLRPDMAIRNDRSGRQNRGRRFAAPREYSLSRRQRLQRFARVSFRLGHRADAVCAERINALYQPDENARISGGGFARDFHADPRCRQSLL